MAVPAQSGTVRMLSLSARAVLVCVLGAACLVCGLRVAGSAAPFVGRASCRPLRRAGRPLAVCVASYPPFSVGAHCCGGHGVLVSL
eukprot:3857862-Alexandrium_andersonii.AAC.1